MGLSICDRKACCHWEQKCNSRLSLIKSGSVYIKPRRSVNQRTILHISSHTFHQRKLRFVIMCNL